MRFCLILFLFVCSINVYAQQYYDSDIHLGQRADSVELIVGREVQGQYNSGGWLIKMNAQTIDYKGQVKEVILCKDNLLLGGFEKGTSLCIHFIVANGILSKIITQFNNLSLDEVKQLVRPGKTNMTDYYFDADYRHYSHVYAAQSGVICAEYRQTIIADLPSGVKEQLKMIAGIY